MIFKTIDDNDSLSGQRIVSKFTARKIAQEEATKQLEIDIQCLRNYEVECQKGSVSTETFSNTMKGASIEAQKYATNIKDGTGSAQTFATNQRTIQASMSETSIVSKIATTGLNIFKAALNSLIFFAVIEGIQLLIKGIDNLILTTDEAEEKAETLRGNMQSFFDEVQSGQQTISSVSDRFSELSKHVTKTGENIDLTKDEYSEYLDICNQVKTIMPELVTGYTNEGNAIIALKDNVDSLTESYKENIKAKAASFITNGDDDGNTIQSFFDDYNIFTNGENGLFAPSAGSLWNNKSTDYEDYYGYDKVHEWLSNVSEMSLKDLQNLQKGTTEATYLYALLKENGYELANITEDDYNAVHDVLTTRLTSLEGEMTTRVSNIKMSLQQMLYADGDYWNIDDKEVLSALDSFFASIDDEFIKQNNLLSQTALQSFESNAVDLFQNKSTKQSMIDIFSPQGEDESIKDYTTRVENAIFKIQKYCDENGITIPFNFGTEDDPKGVQKTVDDLQKSYDDAINRFKDSNKIKDFFDTEGINTDEEVNDFNKVTEGINDADKAIQKWNEHKKASEDSFEIPDADTLKQQISDLNSAIDSIQSAYDTLNSAVEEYNSNGGQLSIDTIQSLLSLSDEYLACLQVENGQLSLNADAMAQLAQAKLDEAQATAVTQAMTELQAIANGEAAQSTANYITGNAALMDSLAQLSGSYEGVAKAAMTAAQAQRMSALISDAAGKDKTATENVMKGLDTKLKLIQTTKASINAGNFGKVAGKSSSSSKGSGSGKSTSDTAKEEIEAYMEYLEKALEGGRITYSDYVRDVTLKLDDMYHNGRITAKEYFDYVEKRLNQQLEVYKSVLSAVTDLLEDEAQKWQDKIDALNDENDLLEKQKDDYDSILSAVDQVYQDEIDRLNEQKDLLQDKIDAINDENDALELQRKKQEALIALDKARQQRNVKIYTEDRGYFYSIDQDAYKDAQQNLQDIKNEEVIKKLEDEQDALDDSIELLEKYRDLWNDIADAYKKKTNEALAVALWGENYEKLILQNRTQDIEAFKDKYLEIQSKIDDNKSLIDSYQEKVDYYNKLKDQWNEISSAYEKEQQRMYAAQILGANWEKDVLDGRLDVLSQFRDQYLEIQRQMTQAALDGARARNDAAASGGTGGSGGSSGGGGGSTPIQNQQAYHVLHLVGGYSTSGEASSKISSFNGKGVYKYKDGKWYVYKEEDYSNLSFGSKSEADDYIKKHLSPAGKFLVKYYHNGLENGLVDFSKKDSNFDLVQKYGLKKYEVPAILKQGEAVMNQEQIKNLGEALRAIPTAATLYTTPDYTKMLSSLKTNNTPVMVTQSVNITLPNVTNNSGYENLTRELNRLKLDAYQFANRRN